MTPAWVEGRGLARTHRDGTRALMPTDLAVAPGETVALLGPSGCGKTTTLRLLAGLDRPDPGGRVLIGGEDVTERPIERRGVGMVFQSYALFPNMTVAGNVGYGPRIRRLPRVEREARVWRCLSLCRIEALAHRRVTELSGGQRQRVALARALAAEPRALFLDEPLAALDAALREGLREEIAALLRETGVTAVHVTHDQAEAMALGHRIAVMREGRIEQIGPPREVYERPATAFVARFVGETFEVTLADGGPALMRPEAARLLPQGEGEPATIRAATYLGPLTRVRLDTARGPVLALDHEGRRLAPGDRIGVALDEARAMRFEDP